jgi:hypothetical protein
MEKIKIIIAGCGDLGMAVKEEAKKNFSNISIAGLLTRRESAFHLEEAIQINHPENPLNEFSRLGVTTALLCYGDDDLCVYGPVLRRWFDTVDCWGFESGLKCNFNQYKEVMGKIKSPINNISICNVNWIDYVRNIQIFLTKIGMKSQDFESKEECCNHLKFTTARLMLDYTHVLARMKNIGKFHGIFEPMDIAPHYFID